MYIWLYKAVASVYESNHRVYEQDWDRQNGTQIVTEMCGFVTILSGTFLLHRTKDMVEGAFLDFIYGTSYASVLFFPSWKTLFLYIDGPWARA